MDGETLGILVAAIAAFIAAVSAFSARRDAAAIRAVTERRERARALLGKAMDDGNEILEVLAQHVRTVPLDRKAEPALKVRVSYWSNAAREAIEKADNAQLARFDAPRPSHEIAAVVKELLRRLQDIQDRL